MKWTEVYPVIVSIAVIVFVAVIQRYSRTLAAITATMPLNIPLALWIVSASEGATREATARFSAGLLLGIGPTVLFVLAAWLAARAGWRTLPTITAGYAAWGMGVGVVFGLRSVLGAG